MNQKDLYNDSESNQINLGRFLRLIMLQSKLIFAITLVGAVIGLTSYFASTKTYEISSLLQVYSPNQSFDPRQSLNLDFFNAPETNLDNLVTLYSSRSNILELIKGLNLNLKINNSDDKKLIDITTFFFKKSEEYDKKIFYLEILNNSFLLLDDKKNVLAEGLSGEYLENDNFEIQLNFPNLSSEKLIQITYTNPSDLYNFYKNKLSLINLGNSRNFWSQEGLIEISLLTDDISKGINIINLANNIFIKDNIKVETEKARTSMVFIDSQLNNLEEILNVRKSELQNFKQENKSLDVNLEVQSIIEMISDVEQNINKVDLEISKAEINFTRDNPLYLNLKNQKEALVLQRNKIEQKIKNLPEAQQEYVDLFTNLEVSEKLYSELINRRLNFSLMEASSIGNIRVVDKAYVKDFVGPRISLVFIFTMISFFLGVITAIFRGIFFISISNPAELQDVGIKEKIVGVLSHCENPDDLFTGNDGLKQSVETSILNIETMISKSQDVKKLPEGTKILITSPTPGNGKSFFSRALSEGLTQIGHKVLLIDADLKRGIQHKIYNKESIEIKSFQDISLEKIDEYKIKDNFYLIPKIKKIKNTFELLYSDSFLDKINEFQTFFDYIIIDTAPVLNVSDTGLLMTNSDINLLVVRHQLTRTNEISQAKQIIEQIGRSYDGIIYNDYQKPKGYYGYYDLYGDYSYRYYAERYLYDDYYSEKDD